MIGREAYHRPMILSEIYSDIAAAEGRDYRPVTVTEYLERMADYAEREMSRGLPAALSACEDHLYC
jgi:hypothetical protein